MVMMKGHRRQGGGILGVRPSFRLFVSAPPPLLSLSLLLRKCCCFFGRSLRVREKSPIEPRSARTPPPCSDALPPHAHSSTARSVHWGQAASCVFRSSFARSSCPQFPSSHRGVPRSATAPPSQQARSAQCTPLAHVSHVASTRATSRRCYPQRRCSRCSSGGFNLQEARPHLQRRKVPIASAGMRARTVLSTRLTRLSAPRRSAPTRRTSSPTP